MKSKFFSGKLFKVFLVLAVFGLLIFFNPSNFFNPVRSVFSGIAAPFQKVAYLISFKAAQVGDFFSSIHRFKQDNEKLVGENQRLMAENAMLKDEKQENSILREQLKLLPRDKFDLETAHVISQDPYGSGNWIEINKGANYGIQKGMPVIISGGILVGRIEEVYYTTAKIILITNPNNIVNGIVADTEVKGIVRGEYGLGIIFDMVLQTDVIKEGDEVITSGLGENMPRGLFIGNIREVKLSSDRLFQQALISSPIKFTRLQTVSVIKNNSNE